MKVIFVIAFTALLSSCSDSNRYEMSKDTKGRTVRLDKRTGEIAVIGDDKVTVLKGQADLTFDRLTTSLQEAPKEWPLMSVPQIADVELKTSWSDEKLNYIFRAGELTPKILDARKKSYINHSFTIYLYDKNDFKIKSFEIPLATLVGSRNEKGEVIILSINDSIPITSAQYSKVTSWNVAWDF